MTTQQKTSTNLYFVGKKPKFLNLIFVANKDSISLFPEDVQKAIHLVDENYFRVDSVEYAEGEVIPYGSYIAWEKPDPEKLKEEQKARIPAGYNLWNKSNAAQQLKDGVLEEVGGRFRQTKIVPVRASFVATGKLPCFEGLKTFPGQISVSDKDVELLTPWGISKCGFGEGFAILYGVYGEDEEQVQFRGCVNGNILTHGTPSFDDYFEVSEDGQIVRTLNELFDELVLVG